MRAAEAKGEAFAFREEEIVLPWTSCSISLASVHAVDEPVPSHHDDFAYLIGTIFGFECDMMMLCKTAQEHRKYKELPDDSRKRWNMGQYLRTSCLLPLFSVTSTTTSYSHTAISLFYR
jgi:hypothetical protein